MDIFLIVCIAFLLVYIVILKIMIEAFSLYIKENSLIPSKELVSEYSKKAVKKFFHIPS